MQSILEGFKPIYVKYRNFLLYIVIGASGVLIDMLIYWLLTSSGVYYQVANVISVHAGIFNNFFWNAWKNYRVKTKITTTFFKFYLVGLCGLLISALLLSLFKDVLNLPAAINLTASQILPGFKWGELIIKGVTVFIVVVFQFFVNHYISFGKD